MARPRKSEFADLEQEWMDLVVSKSKEEIDQLIADIAKAESENQTAKKQDQQLNEAKLEAKEAGEGYREHSKMAKLRIKYCIRVLGDRGNQ